MNQKIEVFQDTRFKEGYDHFLTFKFSHERCGIVTFVSEPMSKSEADFRAMCMRVSGEGFGTEPLPTVVRNIVPMPPLKP